VWCYPESEGLSPESQRRPFMRILFGITLAVVLAFTAWSVSPTVGKARSTVLIDPISMMATTGALPEEQCDQRTIF
jgi:hypothetical protein